MDPTKLRPELLETICIDDFTLKREFGRERGKVIVSSSSIFMVNVFNFFVLGLNPTPTESQKAAVNKLNQQLQVKVKSKSKKDLKEVTETEIQFDLKSRTRVILWRGNVLKKRTSLQRE